MVVLLSKDVDPWAVRAFTEFFGALKGKVPAVEQVTITKGNWRIGWKIPVTLPVNETEQQSIGGSDNAEI